METGKVPVVRCKEDMVTINNMSYIKWARSILATKLEKDPYVLMLEDIILTSR